MDPDPYLFGIRIHKAAEYEPNLDPDPKSLDTDPIWIRIHNADENFNYDGLKITQSLSPTNIRKIGARLLPVPIRYGRYLQETNYSLNVLSVYHKY